ncbi:hypothetical protein CVU37_02870 [candidate division BRC1 bacterium HGW-BRC1-1]|jgi:hypothetical protein|nr:MAG: hypothetical protein CVU37_02870 [candidate division BRC1 bacterium HGW-BRC1-1]
MIRFPSFHRFALLSSASLLVALGGARSAAAQTPVTIEAVTPVAEAPKADPSGVEMSGFLVITPERQTFNDDETKAELKVGAVADAVKAEYEKLTADKLPGQKTFAVIQGELNADKSLDITGFSSMALDRPRKVATAVRIEATQPGKAGRVIGTVNGKDDVFSDAGFKGWVVDEGRTVLFSAPGEGGYEGEGQTLMKVALTCDCKAKPVVSEPQRIDNVREVMDKSERPLWVMELSDGGAGIGHVTVVDPTRNLVILRKSGVKVLDIADGQMKLGVYEGEAAWSDLAAGKTVEPAKREAVDLARARKTAIPNVSGKK